MWHSVHSAYWVYLLLWDFVLTHFFRHCVDIPASVRLVWMILAYPTTETPSSVVFAAQSVQTVEADTTLTEVTRSVQPMVIRDLLFGAGGTSINVHMPYPKLGKFSYQRVSEVSMWNVPLWGAELCCRFKHINVKYCILKWWYPIIILY